jgi:hypothetical protein
MEIISLNICENEDFYIGIFDDIFGEVSQLKHIAFSKILLMTTIKHT